MPRETGGDNKWADLTIFDKKGSKLGRPIVSITYNRFITFSSAFCYRANLTAPPIEGKKYVVLMYSPKNNAIVFDFTNDEHAPGKYKLIKRGNIVQISCSSFLKGRGWNLKEIRGRYEAVNERIPRIGQCWYISLNDKIEK